MKIRAILNKKEGIYLETGDIKSLALNEIPVNSEGDKAFAIIAYPSPGAGYKLALYNDKEKADKAFNSLTKAEKECRKGDIFYEIKSDYVEPVKQEEPTETVPEFVEETVEPVGEAGPVYG
jgi:hypothetical protein